MASTTTIIIALALVILSLGILVDPRLGGTIGTWQSPAELDQQLEGLANRLAQFTERRGHYLSMERRDLYARLLNAAPRLQARYRSRRNMTVVHGDAHVWNIFLPKDAGRDSAGDGSNPVSRTRSADA